MFLDSSASGNEVETMADILPHYTDICSTVGGLDKNAWELWKATGKKKEQLGG
jgi:hypothetical protein